MSRQKKTLKDVASQLFHHYLYMCAKLVNGLNDISPFMLPSMFPYKCNSRCWNKKNNRNIMPDIALLFHKARLRITISRWCKFAVAKCFIVAYKIVHHILIEFPCRYERKAQSIVRFNHYAFHKIAIKMCMPCRGCANEVMTCTAFNFLFNLNLDSSKNFQWNIISEFM